MADHWREKLVEILEKNCVGMDDHDGAGQPTRPLLNRCEKCRNMNDDLVGLIKEVWETYPGIMEREDLKEQVATLQGGLLRAFEEAQKMNAALSARLLALLEKQFAQ